MDPITLLATASAIWSGIKKASEFAAEAEGVFGQLSNIEQDMDKIAPIDQAFLGIMKDIMLLCIGAVGGIVGRKGAYSAINAMKEKE